MLNDFLPAIVSLSILSAAFLFAWTSDVRSTRRADVGEEEPAPIPSLLEVESNESALN